MSNDAFPKVWIADANLATSIWKFKVYYDIGRLALAPHGFRFIGSSRRLEISWDQVENVQMRRQTWAWALQAVFVAMACMFTFAGALADTSFLYALLIGSLPAVAFAVFGRSLGHFYSVPWAVVRYRRAEGVEEAWFADGGSLGWRGKTGGTRKILNGFGEYMHDGAAP